jgi:hypothetical protein
MFRLQPRFRAFSANLLNFPSVGTFCIPRRLEAGTAGADVQVTRGG